MNIWIVLSFALVIAGALFIGYALIRPFTHFDHDHRDVFRPPR